MYLIFSVVQRPCDSGTGVSLPFDGAFDGRHDFLLAAAFQNMGGYPALKSFCKSSGLKLKETTIPFFPVANIFPIVTGIPNLEVV